jgi:DNA topoisomerase VI subunit A
VKKPEKKRTAPPSRAELDAVTIQSIEDLAQIVHGRIKAGDKPSLEFPVRSLGNVSYDADVGYLQIGEATSKRTLTVNTAKGFAQTLLLMNFSRSQIRKDRRSTKREAYYISKNWGEARFDDQPESDTVLDDIEAMFAARGVTREQLRFIAEEHGGAVAGELVVVDKDSETGADVFIDCTAQGSGSWSIPTDVEHLRFETSAKFILCIETGGSFDRLHRAKFWRKRKCIMIAMGGVPSRACRRFVRKLSDQVGIPVYAFTDCDPYGFANIYRTLKVGSGNAAHINQFFCVPNATFLGVTPQDIVDYKLPTHPLLDVDIKRGNDAIKNDPFFSSHKIWERAIRQLLDAGHRAEQQAFVVHTQDYVHDVYLPEKLANTKKFLP